MAGSLNHIVDEDGAFTIDTIENMGDAHEALEECFDIIALLLARIDDSCDGDDRYSALEWACKEARAPMPHMPVFGKRVDG